jgi:glycosyltransferase involved in cell wall biosynthesis
VKAVVIHHTLNSPGGESTVAIETIESLYELGYDIELITVQKPNLEYLTKIYGKTIHITKTRSLIPFKMNYFSLYQRVLMAIPRLGLRESDIIINTHGSVIPYMIPGNVPCITYLHFPISALNTSDSGHSSIKYQKSLLWNAYFKPYAVTANRLMRKALFRSNIILANSKFTKNVLKKVYPQLDSHVLYPPVDIERFSSAYRSNSRKRQVLVISRFSAEKQIEKAISIAQLIQDVKFKVIGLLTPANRPYFNLLQKKIKNYGLEDRVSLIPNATNEEMINAMSESMLYLHTMYGEHFGISIVEAMTAGLVPIVPSYGGCSEIIPSGNQYSTVEEAAKYISKNIDEYNEEKRTMVYDIARQFSSSLFRKNLQQYIKKARNIQLMAA